ncbi:hypothetical protein [Planctomycetes bacterium Poly30]|uniref:hypothetical protein n=1 Tax=Saltatorellus ferox TaxID=2528018 RepID=UPI0011A48CCC
MLIPEARLPELPSESGPDRTPGVLESGEEINASDSVRLAVERAGVVAEWLLSLEPKAAPSSLEGAVVAAIHAGYQQERAVAALARLGRQKAPSGLEQLVAAHVLRTDPQTRAVAPLELDQRVQERVMQPEASMVRGMTDRLPLVHAPSELDLRLERQLVRGDAALQDPSRKSGPGKVFVRRLQVFGASMALAGAIAFFGGVPSSLWVSGAKSRPGSLDQVASSGEIATSASGLSFRVVRLTDETITDAERSLIQALGLPVGGGS